MDITFQTETLLALAIIFQIVFILIGLLKGGVFWWTAALVCTIIWALQIDEQLFYILAVLVGIAQIAGFIHSLQEK